MQFTSVTKTDLHLRKQYRLCTVKAEQCHSKQHMHSMVTQFYVDIKCLSC